MKYLKDTSPPEIKMQKLESLMRELNIIIDSNSEVFVSIDGKEYALVDRETGEQGQVFPRFADSEVLAIKGSF